MDSNLIVLTDQDGNSVRFELLDIVEYKEDEYAVLYPADGGDDEVVEREPRLGLGVLQPRVQLEQQVGGAQARRQLLHHGLTVDPPVALAVLSATGDDSLVWLVSPLRWPTLSVLPVVALAALCVPLVRRPPVLGRIATSPHHNASTHGAVA